MAPEYLNAATRLHPLVPLYAVDCDEESNKPLCSEQVPLTGSNNISLLIRFFRGSKVSLLSRFDARKQPRKFCLLIYLTFQLFPQGKQLPSIEYNGERTANALVYWISPRVPQTSQKLKSVEDISNWAGTVGLLLWYQSLLLPAGYPRLFSSWNLFPNVIEYRQTSNPSTDKGEENPASMESSGKQIWR